MTMDEFLKLEYGSVVISKSNPEIAMKDIDFYINDFRNFFNGVMV